MAVRYAIYAAPRAESPLWGFGSQVLGYDAATGADVPQTPLAGFEGPDWHALTEDPRRYGFHGTLKAPFRLAEGCDEAGLQGALDAFGAGRAPARLDRLAVTAIGRFIALCPEGRPPALHALADAAVEAFEPFRAPLNAAEVAKRKPERLSDRQRAHLDRWGYPYVFEEFRYHMTLTGQVPPERLDAVKAALTEAYAPLADHPFVIDALVLFRQSAPTERFRIVSRHPLRG